MQAYVNEGLSADGPMDKGQEEATQDPPQEARESDQPPVTQEKRGPLHRIALFVVALCALSFVEGISVNGLPNINISTLETRFQLTSSQAGLIPSFGEVGAISLVLLVSYYGGRSHRPRVIAGGAYVMALGCLSFFLPHVLDGIYTYDIGSEEQQVCSANASDVCDHSGDQGRPASRFLPLFILGQALQGSGFTPAFTCGFAYIDDHATPESTAMYIGVTYAVTALGVGAGYMAGGQLLSIWVDIGQEPTITKSDKRWVGAWWIGYIFCSALFFIIATIFCFFPRKIHGSKPEHKEAAGVNSTWSHTTVHSSDERTLWQIILSFPKAICKLLRNPLYILLVFVGLGDTLIVSGIAGFAAKIIEEKFNVEPTESGLIMGAVTLVGGAGGLAAGGFLIQKLRLKLMGIMKMCLLFMLLASVLGGFGFFIGCPQDRFAGITSVYGSAAPNSPASSDLSAQCNSNCSCDTHLFDPICGQDGVTYFSPCYAGCPRHGYNSSTTPETFDGCACILDTLVDGGLNGTGSAVGGQCAQKCPLVWPFVSIIFLGILFTFLNVTPISMSILRCVPPEEKSVGLGLQWVTLRLLGTIPGPILTGAVLDTSCQLWQSTCNGRGSCWMFDRTRMSLQLFLWWVAVKVFAIILLMMAYCYYKRKGHAEVMRQEREDDVSISMQVSPSHSSEGSGKKRKAKLICYRSRRGSTDCETGRSNPSIQLQPTSSRQSSPRVDMPTSEAVTASSCEDISISEVVTPTSSHHNQGDMQTVSRSESVSVDPPVRAQADPGSDQRDHEHNTLGS